MSVMKDNIRKRRSPEGTTQPSPQRKDRRMGIMKCIRRKELDPPIEALQHIKRLKKDVLIEVNTESLLSVNPSQVLETRKQKVYPEGYEGLDESTWLYVSRKSETTIGVYAVYQSDVLKKAETLTEYDEPRDITFRLNFDLSDEKIWEVQLKELEKLPEFCQIDSNKNLLSFANTQLIGMNTVQTYLNVPGNRTPGHQAKNYFCSVNINFGPGITEWFTVPFEFWKKIAKLCAKRFKIPGRFLVARIVIYVCFLRDMNPADPIKWSLLPLHFTITNEEQQKGFQQVPKAHRKINLSTNIAESSITVTEIKYGQILFNFGQQILYCDPTTNYTCLCLEWTSKNQCIQRKGCCGRVLAGHVFRKVPEVFYNNLVQEALSEMMKSSLE
ncbi:unnamed protein product, partial [Allacma fusca]